MDVALKVATILDPGFKFRLDILSNEIKATNIIPFPTSKITSAIASWELIDLTTQLKRLRALDSEEIGAEEGAYKVIESDLNDTCTFFELEKRRDFIIPAWVSIVAISPLRDCTSP